MKKLLYFFAIAGLVFALGCSKLKSLTNISVDIPYEQDIYVPAIYDTLTQGHFPINGIYHQFPAMAVITNSQQTIANSNTSVDKITSISLKSTTLQMVNPSGANFDYLDSVSVYISATNLPTVLFASKAAIGKGQNIFSLDAAPNDSLKNYFLKDTIYLQFNAQFNNVPPASSDIKSKVIFTMTANPLN